MTVDIVTGALLMAWLQRKPNQGVIFHNDRGSQNASQAMMAQLGEYGLTVLMRRKGTCWDNAPTESFFNNLKGERVHSTTHPSQVHAQVDLFERIEMFYNWSRRDPTLS